MTRYSLAIFILLTFIMCNDLYALDTLPLQDGIYVPVDHICPKVTNWLELAEDEIITHIYNGVFGYNDFMASHDAKKIKKDGNRYRIIFDSEINISARHGNRHYSHTCVVELDDNSGFTLISDTDKEGSGKKNKPIRYKYCGKEGSATQSDVISPLIGKWEGEFQLTNPHGKKYTAKYEYVIYQNPEDSSELLFKQTDVLTFSNKFDMFSCSMSNTYTNHYSGIVQLDGADNLKFIQKSISNHTCGNTGIDMYKMSNDVLIVVNVNSGGITSGVLHHQR